MRYMLRAQKIEFFESAALSIRKSVDDLYMECVSINEDISVYTEGVGEVISGAF